jgi:outer membrane protein OmpA-like peptidoglycan-associated protein
MHRELSGTAAGPSVRAMRIVFLLCLLPLPALAQVTTDESALKALNPAAPAKTTPAASAKPHATAHHVVHHTSAPRAKPAALPAVPAAPPANPVIVPPPPVIPMHPPVLPPAIKPNPAATTTATHINGGTRLVFGAGSAELNQPTFDALTEIATAAKADPTLEISVTAWAPGAPEDPSTPHRLSLDRVLAARAVLIHAGIVSERIHAVAKGTTDITAGPADRMDVVATHPTATPAGTAKK